MAKFLNTGPLSSLNYGGSRPAPTPIYSAPPSYGRLPDINPKRTTRAEDLAAQNANDNREKARQLYGDAPSGVDPAIWKQAVENALQGPGKDNPLRPRIPGQEWDAQIPPDQREKINKELQQRSWQGRAETANQQQAQREANAPRNKAKAEELMAASKAAQQKSNAAHSAWVNSTGTEKTAAKQAYDQVNKQFQSARKAYESHQKSIESKANKLSSTIKSAQAKAENALAAMESATGPRRETLRQQYEANMRAIQTAQGEWKTIQEQSGPVSEKLFASAQEAQKLASENLNAWQNTKSKQELKQDWERARYESNRAAQEFNAHQRDPDAYHQQAGTQTASVPNSQQPQSAPRPQPAPSPSPASFPANNSQTTSGKDWFMDFLQGTVPGQSPTPDTRGIPSPTLQTTTATTAQVPTASPIKTQQAVASPLDKLDQITQGRDIFGNEIKTADMLVSGGVKLQKNQRADRGPTNFGGLQFRNIGGQTRVVGTNQPRNTKTPEPTLAMGQQQPDRGPATTKQTAIATGMR
jgi:hypothetical protein